MPPAGRSARPPCHPSAGHVRALALACHPAPTLAVTAVSVLLAAGVGLRAGQVALFGAAVFTGQLSIGWSNDRIDAGRDAASARTDKPAAAGRVPLRVVALAATIALLLSIALSLTLGVAAASAALTLVASGWAYNLGLKATLWSGAAYAVGFGALPVAPYLALPGHAWPPWWVPVTGALLGFGAHFANVLPDLRDDSATGVRGLPHRLGPRAAVVVMAAALAAASVVLAVGPRPVSVPFAAVVSVLGLVGATAVAGCAVRAPDSPVAFRITMVLAVLDAVVLIVAAT